MNKTSLIIILLSLLFVLFSFTPSIFEIVQRNLIPPEREFLLDHNYLFDYNFYISRIREGQEGRMLVTEKYYSQPHQSSLLQIVYLYLGKIGLLLQLDPAKVYHGSRLVFGFLFLVLVGWYTRKLFSPKFALLAFLFSIILGSWPIPINMGTFWRFGTYMGWWSVIDSLSRITSIPHVLIGQIFLLLFIWRFSGSKSLKGLKLLIWGFFGLITGIIFPPTLIVLYVFFAVQSAFEFFGTSGKNLVFWVKRTVFPRGIFFLFSFPSFLYLQFAVSVQPWKALSLFDIQHRIPLPYNEYVKAMGPIFILGIVGGIIAVIRKERKLYPAISWIIAIWILFKLFENFPTQSPLRFTEAAIHIPLAILASYFIYCLIKLARHKFSQKVGSAVETATWVGVHLIIVLGLSVMVAMVGWLSDQGIAKRFGTWPVPIGAQLVYPLKDFMDAVRFLGLNTSKNSVVMAYITGGNFIPAYAGNYVYIGHANTPDEDGKEKIAAEFFSGKMRPAEAREFLQKERVSFVFFGPQERELANWKNLNEYYPYLSTIFANNRVVIYRVTY